MSGSYTEDDLKVAVEAAIAEALAPFQEEAALEALTAAIEDVKAPLVAQIQSLQNDIDTATLRADTAEANYSALVALLEEAQAEIDRAAEMATRREARKEAVKDLAFKPEWIEERLDRWVALSDADFAELVDGWKAFTPASKKEDVTDDTSIPTTTAMKASREDNQDRFTGMRELAELGLRGGNIRNL